MKEDALVLEKLGVNGGGITYPAACFGFGLNSIALELKLFGVSTIVFGCSWTMTCGVVITSGTIFSWTTLGTLASSLSIFNLSCSIIAFL